jgi:hypothetical protein
MIGAVGKGGGDVQKRPCWALEFLESGRGSAVTWKGWGNDQAQQRSRVPETATAALVCCSGWFVSVQVDTCPTRTGAPEDLVGGSVLCGSAWGGASTAW